jgi:hypothetical protein
VNNTSEIFIPNRIGDFAPINMSVTTENAQSGNLPCENYYTIGASVQGKFHKINKTYRDDAFTAMFRSPWLVICVADGAGSRENSRFGALYCTSTLCDEIIESLPHLVDNVAELRCPNDSHLVAGNSQEHPISHAMFEQSLLDSFIRTRKGLDEFAKKNTLSSSELHCTLLSFALNVKTGEFVAGQVGDGLILGLTESQKVAPLIEANTPDDPSTTYFFTQEDWRDHYVSKAYIENECNQYLTFYIMTDGVANDCQYEPPVGILSRWAKDIDREIRSEDNLRKVEDDLKIYLENYKAPGSFDDRTLVLIWRRKNNSIINE